jgi:protein gp37
MGQTAIGWTGTRVAFGMRVERDIKAEGEVFLAAGAYPAGTVLPGFTFNTHLGCEKISRACKRCYAQTLVEGRMGYGNPDSPNPARRLPVWGPPATTARPRTSPANWKRPRRWNALAESLGVRLKVFCGSLMDVGEDHPDVRALRPDLWELVEATPSLDWLLLTKRPHVLRAEWPAQWRETAPHNVWAGATVEHQTAADERVPELLGITARVLWLSCEPLCGPLDLAKPGRYTLDPDHHNRAAPMRRNGRWGCCSGCPRDAAGMRYPERCAFTARYDHNLTAITWVVAGGESGPGHETMELSWLTDLHRQCADAGVAFFTKQDSGALPGRQGRIPDDVWATKQWPEVTK